MREVIACSREQKGSKLFACPTRIFVKKTAPQSAFAASLRRLKANFQYENTQWVLCRCHGQRPLSLFGFSGAAKGILRVIAQTLQPAVNHVVQAVFRKSALFQSATD